MTFRGLFGAYLTQEAQDGYEREAYDVEEVAFDPGDPAGGVALDAVGAGLVEGVAGEEVGFELGWGDFGEGDGGGFYVGLCVGLFVGLFVDLFVGGRKHGYAGVNVVGAACQGAEHAGGIGAVRGFVEDLAFEDDGGVGGEDGLTGVQGGDGAGFFEGQAADVDVGEFAGVEGFVDVGGVDVVRDGDLGEEVAAAWGGGGEDEHLWERSYDCGAV